uniref:tryptophan--tRNA ligase n=1 Tax=Nothobranchius rachovii TaxID=451742 RepID=A0A1A8SBP0_9TELE
MALPCRNNLKFLFSFLPKSNYWKRSFCAAMSPENQNPPGSGRVFSGIQPTGVPHLGNYLGALENWVSLQNQYSSVLFIREETKTHLIPSACFCFCFFPFSPPPSRFLFSFILLVLLSQWFLQVKSKQKNEGSVGLYTYPVLQAADILLYKSTHVPVGEDQVQHLELAQDLARIFNYRYGDVFPEARALLSSTRKVKSLRDPSAKMSKSDIQAMATISITDSPDDIALKIRRAVTDFTSEVTFDPETRPGVSNLVTIHAAMAAITVQEAVSRAKGLDTGAYKALVSEAVIQRLTPIREEFQRLRADRAHLQNLLELGNRRARELAAPVLAEVRHRVGFS